MTRSIPVTLVHGVILRVSMPRSWAVTISGRKNGASSAVGIGVTTEQRNRDIETYRVAFAAPAR